MSDTIIKTEYSDIMQKSYIDYAMSVIVARALPDVRDGLKPVQRRTLYDMHELGIRHDRPYRKCARIVGDTMGKYHPHGDSSIYEALVVMSQDFKKGLPLVDGHGNFGSIEGDWTKTWWTLCPILMRQKKSPACFRPGFPIC